jgi:BMFP domain-containing protein YqiC
MRPNRPRIEDLATLGGNVLGHLLGLRHEARTRLKDHFEGFTKQLDLVGRDEFDAAFAMLAKARAMQEELSERLAVLEGHLNLSSKRTVKTGTKRFLPSVKKSNQRRARK